jgi:hypothetical protein
VAGLEGGGDAGVVGDDGREARAVVGRFRGGGREEPREGGVEGLHGDAAARADAIDADGWKV